MEKPQTHGILSEIKNKDTSLPMRVRELSDLEIDEYIIILNKITEAESKKDYIEAKRLAQIYLELVTEYPSQTEAKEILGKESFFGTEEIADTFNLREEEFEEIPKIPFTHEELEIAKKENQFLIFRLDNISPNKHLTIPRMEELTQSKLQVIKEIPIDLKSEIFPVLASEGAYCRKGWALVDKVISDQSKDGDYADESEYLAERLKKIFEGLGPMSAIYEEALEKFKSRIETINDYKEYYTNGEIGEERLNSEIIKLNYGDLSRLLRHNIEELIYDLIVYKVNTGEYLLNNTEEGILRTRSQTDSEKSIMAGDFGERGLIIRTGTLIENHPHCGVLMSRRATLH